MSKIEKEEMENELVRYKMLQVSFFFPLTINHPIPNPLYPQLCRVGTCSTRCTFRPFSPLQLVHDGHIKINEIDE